jgi:choline dehydrogenase
VSRRFDVAIIGAGSAGCVVAHELVRSGLRVALIEAGPDYGRYSSRWPRDIVDPKRRSSRHDWGFRAELAPRVVTEEERARVMGGCSAHNECAAVWPPREDIDAWDLPGWSSAELWPLTDRIESARGGAAERGRSGPLTTVAWTERKLTTWQSLFLEAAIGVGYSPLADAGCGSAAGVGPFFANLRHGARLNSAFAFLDPVRSRSRLEIFARTEARQFRMRGDHAEAVICRRARAELVIDADRYLLCAGTYGSPTVLRRSGLGSRELGHGLQDHPGVAISLRARSGAPRDLRSRSAYRSQIVLRAASEMTPLPWDLHILPYQADGELRVFVFFMTPRSRGVARLGARRPRIRFHFFEGEGKSDLDALVAGVEIARELIARIPSVQTSDPAFGLAAREQRRWIQANVTSYAHAVGTCRMGTDAAAVVDAKGRVRGLANLQVADGSIVPRIPRANTNLLCMLIGMRMAQAS